jgi:FKBP-type peptidyl-prolyl cis-trans isomerase
MRPVRCAPLALVLVLAGCRDGDQIIDPTDIDFAAELDIDLARMTRTSTGLYIEDVTVGTGDAAADGDEVTLLYSGWLPDGMLFGTTDDDDIPLVRTLGVADPTDGSRLIEGFREGVTGMQVGGVRKLVIPPQLGYGAQANGLIPPNSTLVFRVELISIGYRAVVPGAIP